MLFTWTGFSSPPRVHGWHQGSECFFCMESVTHKCILLGEKTAFINFSEWSVTLNGEDPLACKVSLGICGSGHKAIQQLTVLVKHRSGGLAAFVSFSVKLYRFIWPILTSWFSWKSTRYSDRCCLINFMMISCLILGSKILANRHASLRTLLGPPGLW